MKKKLPAYLVLLCITLIAGLVLGLTYSITKDPIAAESARKAEQARAAALPEADTFRAVRETIGDVTVSSAQAQGKMGPVFVEVQMDKNGVISDLTIGNDQYQETPEYAAAVLEDAYKAQFIGKKAPFASVKAGAEESAAGSVTASAQGFASPVAVTATFDGNTITSFKIGDDKFAETIDKAWTALEPAFAEQFIGKTVPLSLSDIDAITGATYTSTAVVNAANKAYDVANATPIDAITGATVTCDAVVAAVNSAAAGDTGMDWCFEGLKDDQVVGYVAQTTVQGFGGPVEIIVGVNRDQTVTGISVGGSNFSETAGLGAKAKEDAFTSQFIGKNAAEQISAKKAGEAKGENDIDAITAATITSGKVAGGVNQITGYALPLIEALPKPPVEMIKPETTYTASSKGHVGPVQIEAGFEGDEIVYLVIGGDKFMETDGIGTKALDPAFAEQFIGLTAPITKDDIDVITGATVTSEAVVSAVNKAYDKSKTPVETPVENNTAAPAENKPAAGEVISASAKGYAGPVQVEVSFDETGKIATLKIGGDKFKETENLGTKALEPVFAEQFIGKQAPIAITDIDAITGATLTSEAVVSAINKAYDKFKPAVETTTETVAPAAPASAANQPISASSKGFKGPVQVEVSFDENGKIATLNIGGDKFMETDGIGTKALDPAFKDQFIGKQAPVVMGDIDVITGATITTEAVVNAINKAYDKAFPAQ